MQVEMEVAVGLPQLLDLVAMGPDRLLSWRAGTQGAVNARQGNTRHSAAANKSL